jgi:hypothetical protein
MLDVLVSVRTAATVESEFEGEVDHRPRAAAPAGLAQQPARLRDVVGGAVQIAAVATVLALLAAS